MNIYRVTLSTYIEAKSEEEAKKEISGARQFTDCTIEAITPVASFDEEVGWPEPRTAAGSLD